MRIGPFFTAGGTTVGFMLACVPGTLLVLGLGMAAGYKSAQLMPYAMLASYLVAAAIFAGDTPLAQFRHIAGDRGAVRGQLTALAASTLGCTAFGFGIACLLYWYVPGFRRLPSSAIGEGWAGALLVALIAPLVEEFVFRGILLRRLLEGYGPVAAIATSAFWFALVHGYPVKLAPVFLMGLLWGWLYWRTRSIWPSVFGHVVNNGLCVALTAFGPAMGDVPPRSAAIVALLLVGGALAVFYGVTRLRGTLRPVEVTPDTAGLAPVIA